MSARSSIGSVGLFCGSSTGVRPQWVEHAAAFGRILAAEGVRLVYGGGGLGLMGACARAVTAGGGRVLGVIPEFLRLPEVAYEEAELVMVASMHERKARMFEEADGFVIMPGGVGTLEEVIEILSWIRLDLHRKPVLFFNADDYWTPLFELVDHTVREGFTPPQFPSAYVEARRVEEILPTLEAMAEKAGQRAKMPLTVT
jgi:uncharacterized protein (TIGR00730 family)